MKLFLTSLVLAVVTVGCLSVHAWSPTVISVPTQLTEAQTGDFVLQGGSLYGLPAPTGQGVRITGNVLIQAPALLQDLVIEGCVRIERAGRVEMLRVWVQHCKSGDGIEIISSAANESCCAKLTSVFSGWNAGSGLRLPNTADVFITLSEFENNDRYGLELHSSPTARIAQSDFGGNTLGGLYANSESNMLLLSNNQYGNNKGDDLQFYSQRNIINSQEFIGPPGACALRYSGSQQIGTNMYGPRPVCPQ